MSIKTGTIIIMCIILAIVAGFILKYIFGFLKMITYMMKMSIGILILLYGLYNLYQLQNGTGNGFGDVGTLLLVFISVGLGGGIIISTII